jgi:hypothetical protein
MNNRTKRYLLPSAGVAGLFLIGSLMQYPGSQAKGAYSTPVAVMNTTSAPAINLSADTMTRIPYQSTVLTTCGAGGLQNCAFNGFTTVPTGYRLVVTNVSGFFNLQSGSTPLAGYMEDFDFVHGIQTFTGLNAPIGGTGFNGESFAGLNQNVLSFFDAGQTPFVVIYGNFMGTGFNNGITVSGYLENCSVVGCPAIQR